MDTSTFNGKISASMISTDLIHDLCARHIPLYDPARYDIVAIRVFSANEFVVTIYAADKQFQTSTHSGKLMVKKFKIENVILFEVLNCIKDFNFTLFSHEFDAEDMEVINK